MGFELLKVIVMVVNSESNSHAEKPIKSEELKLHRLPERSRLESRALSAIFWGEWFTRVWVIQETEVASSIIICCGTEVCSWSDMITVARYTLDHSLDAVDPNRIVKLSGFNGRDKSKLR